MQIQKITPVLFTEEAEPCIQFWVERFGFEKTAEVPDDGKVGFAILKNGSLELMYQTFASAEKFDTRSAALARLGPSFLFVEVADLDQTLSAVGDAEVVAPEHTTFYGSREVSVKDPAGHVVTFAQF